MALCNHKVYYLGLKTILSNVFFDPFSIFEWCEMMEQEYHVSAMTTGLISGCPIWKLTYKWGFSIAMFDLQRLPRNKQNGLVGFNPL